MILGKERDLQVLWTKLICIYIYDILPCIRLYFFFFFNSPGRTGEEKKESK